MTPRETEDLTEPEFRAFWSYFEANVRAHEREARKAARRRR